MISVLQRLKMDETSYDIRKHEGKHCYPDPREKILAEMNFDQYLGAYFLSEFENRTAKISTRPVADQNKIIARVVSQAEKYKKEPE